jgi:Protein of unknown function (DUF3179)
LIPTIDGTMHHFNVAGLYDALFVMQDTETKTLWNHITGEAVYGELIGRNLPVSNLLQMNVKQALAFDPNIAVAISSRPFYGATQRMAPDSRDAALSARFIETLGTEDTRRPRMDMGLGVWSGDVRRYYPMEVIRQRGQAFIDVIDNKKVLIYIDPESSTPAALFVAAKEAKLQGNEIRLDDGTAVRAGLLIGSDGQSKPVERPQQIFTRWYGFALTFPQCEVFGQ